MKDVNPLEHFVANENTPFKEQARELIGEYMKTPIGQKAIQHYIKLDKELKEDEIVQYALKTGDKIPDFDLYNAEGKKVNIYEFHQSEWLVISFYRGQFCPFCNLELKNLQRSLSLIEKSPARLVAISPQTIENTRQTVEKNNLQFEMLSDVGGKVGKMFNLIFTVPDYLVDFHKQIGIDDQYFDEKGKMELPMPATYIIDKEGIIRFHYIETNPAFRLAPEKIVDFIKNYKLKELV